MTSPTPTNWFVRILICLFILFLGGLIVISFLKGEAFSISSGIYATLLLMAVLILSESFNNLSIGKVLSLTKTVEQEKAEKKELRNENTLLRDSFVKLSLSIKQTQANTTIITPDLIKALTVTKAGEQDKEDKERAAAEIEQPASAPPATLTKPAGQQKLRYPESARFRRNAEAKALAKFLQIAGLPNLEVSREVKFSDAFQNIDPIMERSVVFDAYYKAPSKEFFFEVMATANPLVVDRLYVMLAKILFYRQAKQIPAELTLIYAKTPSEILGLPSYFSIEKLVTLFQPAIASNLLRVEIIQFSEAEVRELMESAKNENHP